MDSTIEEKVLARIEANRDEIIAFLRGLLSFPSVTGDELEIQQFIARRLEIMGLEIDMWEPDLEELKRHPAYVAVERGYENRPNLVGKYSGTGGGRSLLFNGHVDVVPPGPLESWEHPPWAGEIAGDRIYGRGVSDMKGGVAAMTMAVEAVLAAGVKPQGDILLEYVMDEELSGNGTLACVMKGYRADAGICCETSSLSVQPACLGRIWFEIRIKGKPAGIQRRWEGVNAIEKGYMVVEAVSRLEAIRIDEISHPLYHDNRGAMPCMVGVFQSGSFPSSFPDTCLLQGSIASLPGEETAAVKRQFEEFITAFAATDPWLKDHPPEVIFSGYCGDPAEIPVDHPIVTTVSKMFNRVTGEKARITGREGAADIRYLIKYGDTPTVIFGPGLTEQM
ncbi:MAG TPA: ArgE/DapE family deacylase, partial [Proteobacteria bacterium]|nr:ArgE/DapE family deacylase [Pseudomonadota bacterium]